MVCYGQGLGVRVPAKSLFNEEKFAFFDLVTLNVENFLRGSAQNLEKSGAFAWRRGGLLPPPRSGFGRGARRRNSLGTIFVVFLGWGGIWQVSCHTSQMSQMSLSSLLSK